jgi:hypothetical protein
MHRKLLCAMTSIVLLAALGCSDDSTAPTNKTASPALPAASSMQIDLQFPGTEGLIIAQGDNQDGQPGPEVLGAVASHENWINAYVRATYLVLTTYDNLETPIKAFAAAIHSRPQKQEDGSYLWTYIYVNPDSHVEYSIFLFATPGDESIAWRMEVSSNDPALILDHFVWFTGESARNERSGYWQFYAPINATDGAACVRIDWTRQPSDRRLTILVNKEGAENQGDTLDFHETLAAHTIDYFDASANQTSNITWYPDGSGSLTVPDYNGGATACWDNLQNNVACE